MSSSDGTGARAPFDSGKHPERPVARHRPPGLSDDLVAALGKVSEALEAIEAIRGHLYLFHRLSGTADLTLQEGVRQLREAGRDDLADEIDRVLVGRDVVPGYWTFQLVEAYDEHYVEVFRGVERWMREQAGDVPRHLYEAEMKHREQGGEE